MNTKSLRTLSGVLFFLGIAGGLTIAVISLWTHFEALNYFFTGAVNERFNGLKCPVLLTRSETGTITAALQNPTDREINFFYRTEVGGRFSTRQNEGRITVPPHQARSIDFTVNAEDIDLRSFIFVKITVLSNRAFPVRDDTCGIMVLDSPVLAGGQIFAGAFTLSLLTIVAGLGLGESTRADANLSMRRPMQTLGIVVMLAMLAGVIGWWLAGILLVVISILLLMIMMRFAFH